MVFELVKVVTPLQAGIAVVLCIALSARHFDQYNKHMEKYEPLGGLLIDKRAHNNKRVEAQEVAKGAGDDALRRPVDRLVQRRRDSQGVIVDAPFDGICDKLLGFHRLLDLGV